MTETIDWGSLGFAYRDTNCHVIYRWRDGAWDSGALQSDPYFNIHIAATALHYGQSAFEGLKAFRNQDGDIRLFRPERNAARLQTTARRIMMPEVPEALFLEAVKRVVRENEGYVPPYGSGGALYIRPLLFGTGAEIGLAPAREYAFIVLVMPVGDYYKEGVNAIDAMVVEDFDRAAPQGLGHVKVAGNYAAGLLPGTRAKSAGFPIALYLDAKEHKYVDEFGTSNFIGITKEGKYITPNSPTVLPSITNMSLMQIAKDLGMVVEQRAIPFAEVPHLAEVGACGTAVAIAPVRKVVKGDKHYMIQEAGGFGPCLKKLYETLRRIQVGDLTDDHGWLQPL